MNKFRLKRIFKTIKRIFVVLVIFSLSFLITFSENTVSGAEILQNEAAVVQITASSDDEQLIYENELVRIEIGCDQYVTLLDHQIVLFMPYEYIVGQFEETKSAILAENSCIGAGIVLNEYDAVNALEIGLGAVYDKQTDTWVDSIQIWYYAYSCGALCGQSSRSFYLPNKTMFIHVVDVVS